MVSEKYFLIKEIESSENDQEDPTSPTLKELENGTGQIFNS
jgi:hypothetical protein